MQESIVFLVRVQCRGKESSSGGACFRRGGANCLLAAPSNRTVRVDHFSYPTRS